MTALTKSKQKESAAHTIESYAWLKVVIRRQKRVVCAENMEQTMASVWGKEERRYAPWRAVLTNLALKRSAPHTAESHALPKGAAQTQEVQKESASTIPAKWLALLQAAVAMLLEKGFA